MGNSFFTGFGENSLFPHLLKTDLLHRKYDGKRKNQQQNNDDPERIHEDAGNRDRHCPGVPPAEFERTDGKE